MTRAFLSQTNFSAGELDPRMLGRSDLRSFENGAATLRNVVVETTGGVRRRPGMAYVAPAAGRGRLVDLEIGPGLAYLLAFSDFQVDVYRDGVLRATVLTPWEEQHLAQIAWAQLEHSLLVTHPDISPRSNSSARAIRSGRSPNGNSSRSARLRSRASRSPASPQPMSRCSPPPLPGRSR
jgi:hypothetical protein